MHQLTHLTNLRNEQPLTTSPLSHQQSSNLSHPSPVSCAEVDPHSRWRTVHERLLRISQTADRTLPHHDSKSKQSHQRCIPRNKTSHLIGIKTNRKPWNFLQHPSKHIPPISFLPTFKRFLSQLSPQNDNVKNRTQSLKILRLNAL